MKPKILLTVGMLALFATTFAYGAEALVTASVPFQFTVGAKVLPAGQYEFVPGVNEVVMSVLSLPRGASVMAPVITRLAAGMHTTPADSHLVFDKVGETYTLSEIWAPGVDGYLLHSTKGKHEHKILDVPR